MDSIREKILLKVPEDQRDFVEWVETETDIYAEFPDKKGNNINVIDFDKRENRFFKFTL